MRRCYFSRVRGRLCHEAEESEGEERSCSSPPAGPSVLLPPTATHGTPQLHTRHTSSTQHNLISKKEAWHSLCIINKYTWKFHAQKEYTAQVRSVGEPELAVFPKRRPQPDTHLRDGGKRGQFPPAATAGLPCQSAGPAMTPCFRQRGWAPEISSPFLLDSTFF